MKRTIYSLKRPRQSLRLLAYLSCTDYLPMLLLVSGLLFPAMLFGQIAHDATTISTTTSNTKTVSHTTGSGSGLILMVGISMHKTNDADAVSSMTYGGNALTFVGAANQNSGSRKARVEIWRLVSPPSGANDLVVNFNASIANGAVVTASTYSGVAQTTPLGTFAGTAEQSSGTASQVVTSAAGEMVFDCVAFAGTGGTLTVGASQTQRATGSANSCKGGVSTEAGAASVTMSWTNTTAYMYAIGAVSMKPFSAAPGGVSGAAIWLKADAGVTTGATFTWADQSGNNRNGTQTTLANQPTVATNNINFNPALTFDGTNDRLVLANLTGLPTGAAAVQGFSVARNLNTAGSWQHIISYGGSAGNTFFTLGKHTGTANAIAAFNGSDAISSALEFTGGAAALLDGKYTGTQGIISTFGTQQGTITFTGAKATTSGRVGCDPLDASFWNGNIGEAIIYPGNLTTTQVNQVNSYLAIKFGITKAGNYLASDGTTTIWTSGGGYDNNIAGIARDDASALNQKQSKSVNTASSGDLVAMGLGAIATTNALNANTFSADKSFLAWGDNGGANAWQTTESQSVLRKRLTREWKVQETGTVGNVVVRVQDDAASSGGELPAETTTVYLWVDANGDFSSGVTEYAMTLSSNNWEVSVDFATGQFFTFATQVPPAPGGVTANLNLWLKADAGALNGASQATNGQSVTTWQDQGTGGNNFTTATSEGVVTGSPTWAQTATNFNPSLSFNGTQGLHRSANIYTNNSNLSIFNVHRNALSSGTVIFTNNSGDVPNPLLMTWGYNQWTTSTPTQFSVTAGGSTQANIYGLTRVNTGGSNYTVKAFFEGKETGSTAVSVGFATNNNKTTIGYRSHTNASLRNPHTDDINEVIVYSAELTASEQQRVNTYLALKYGTSLDQTIAYNYLASDGSTIFWNGSTNSGFKNNIAGIARDDASGLSQKQSISVNSGLQVVVGNGNTIASNNAANTSTFSADKSALVWGDDAASVAAWTTTGAPTSRQIVARKWKVQETGTIGYVKVQVPDNSGSNGLPAETNTVYLLVDADGNFSSGATEHAMTLSGTNWEAAVNFTTGQFFTFATQENSPVTLNLAMTVNNATVAPGGTLQYVLTLTNSGSNTATTVKVKDQLPGGVTFNSATPSTGTYDSVTGIWTVPTLAPGSATLTINVTAQ